MPILKSDRAITLLGRSFLTKGNCHKMIAKKHSLVNNVATWEKSFRNESKVQVMTYINNGFAPKHILADYSIFLVQNWIAQNLSERTMEDDKSSIIFFNK